MKRTLLCPRYHRPDQLDLNKTIMDVKSIGVDIITYKSRTNHPALFPTATLRFSVVILTKSN